MLSTYHLPRHLVYTTPKKYLYSFTFLTNLVLTQHESKVYYN